jgi:hypothetical protein
MCRLCDLALICDFLKRYVVSNEATDVAININDTHLQGVHSVSLIVERIHQMHRGRGGGWWREQAKVSC